MFKVGETVYCIDNKYYDSTDKNETIFNIFLDKPYIVSSDFGTLNLIRLVDNNSIYETERFISEKEYKISKRVEKIKKIKNEIH